MRELDDKRPDDKAIKGKICEFCHSPRLVFMSRTATEDLGCCSITKVAMLTAVDEHISNAGRVFTDRMDNGDTAYILNECNVGDVVLYIKMKFWGDEKMLVFSAHPPRRWC